MGSTNAPIPSRRLRVLAESCLFCQYRAASSPFFPRQSFQRIHTTAQRLYQQQQQQQQQQHRKTSNQLPPSSTSRANFPTESAHSPQPNAPTSQPKPKLSFITGKPRAHVRARDGELVPKPLSKPLGLTHPPSPGENTGIDTRSFSERKDAYVSYERHLARRNAIFHEIFERNYFRDLANVGKEYKGKSIIAPATPYRRNIAGWFPNLRGRTLKGVEMDTTSVLMGKLSIVKMVSTDWAGRQTASYAGKERNKPLWEFLESEEGKRMCQVVEVNVQQNPLKYWLVRAYAGRIRRLVGESQWGKYFLIRRGVSEDIMEALGMWNAITGYVYLLDRDCKIRWAGDGDADDKERESLVRCIKRLADEARGVTSKPARQVRREDPKPTGAVEEELEQQAVSAGAS